MLISGVIKPAQRQLHRIGQGVLNFVLPPTCLVCGAETADAGLVCGTCFSVLRPIVSPQCDSCGVPLVAEGFADSSALCVECSRSRPLWRRARSAFVYDEGVRRLILPLKYGDRTENIRFLAQAMCRAGAPLLEGADIVAPVPLHWRRMWRRRYNQAALLARRLAHGNDGPIFVPDLLQRPRPTRALATMSARERKQVMENAVMVKGRWRERLSGKRVVLVDDVLTTGATAEACSRKLLEVGVASVDLVTAARTEHVLPRDADDE